MFVPGTYEVDEIGDPVGLCQRRRGLHSNANDNEHSGEGEHLLIDSKGAHVMELNLNGDRPTTPEFRAALLVALRDYLDAVDPLE